jgi:hypothetical protein
VKRRAPIGWRLRWRHAPLSAYEYEQIHVRPFASTLSKWKFDFSPPKVRRKSRDRRLTNDPRSRDGRPANHQRPPVPRRFLPAENNSKLPSDCGHMENDARHQTNDLALIEFEEIHSKPKHLSGAHCRQVEIRRVTLSLNISCRTIGLK